MFAHVHGTGRFYGSRGVNWIKLRDEATTLVNADISGKTQYNQNYAFNHELRNAGTAAVHYQN